MVRNKVATPARIPTIQLVRFEITPFRVGVVAAAAGEAAPTTATTMRAASQGTSRATWRRCLRGVVSSRFRGLVGRLLDSRVTGRGGGRGRPAAPPGPGGPFPSLVGGGRDACPAAGPFRDPAGVDPY